MTTPEATDTVERVSTEPEAETKTSLHDIIVAAIHTHDPKFATRHKNEQIQTYYKRVLKQLSAVSEETWQTLPEDAKDWNNVAANAFKASKTIPSIPGFDEGPEKPEKAEKTTRVSVAKEPKPPKAPKAAKEPPAPKPPKPDGVIKVFRRMLLLHPTASAKDLIEQLTAQRPDFKINVGTLSIIYSDAHALLNLQRELKESGQLAA